MCLGDALIPPSSFLIHHSIYRGVTHPGRTVTVWERGVRRGASASRPDQSKTRSRGDAEIRRHGDTAILE
jgi:hypothetical protein